MGFHRITKKKSTYLRSYANKLKGVSLKCLNDFGTQQKGDFKKKMKSGEFFALIEKFVQEYNEDK